MKNKLHFLIITADTFPPFRVDVSVLFGEEMIKRGHQIDWLMQSEKILDKEEIVEWKGSRVYVGPTNQGESRFSRIKKHLIGIKHDFNVFKLAASNQYDFIQVKDKFLSAIFAIIAAKKNKCKFYYWLSYPYPEASIYESRVGTARYPLLYLIRGYVFKYILYRIIIRFADHVFVQSEQMKRDVMKEGISGEKLTPVPMGISLKMFEHIKQMKKSNDRKKRIIYLGTLLSTRKLDFIIRVFARVKREIPESELLLVGPEELPGDIQILKDESEKYNVSESVIITGRLERNEAFSYVDQADVGVSPFYPTPILNSTSPTKLIEYMALRKPVVANDHPDQSLVINESGGGICVAYDEKEFADAIIKLLLNQDLAAEMGEKGYQYATHYRTYDYLSELVETKYLELS